MYQHGTLFWCSKRTRESHYQMLTLTLPMKGEKPCGLAQAPQSPISSKPKRATWGCAPNVTALHCLQWPAPDSGHPITDHLRLEQNWINLSPYNLNLQDRRRGFKHLPSYSKMFYSSRNTIISKEIYTQFLLTTACLLWWTEGAPTYLIARIQTFLPLSGLLRSS